MTLNTTANTRVNTSPNKVDERSRSTRAWWLNVKVEPDDSNSTVFNRGISKQSRGNVPIGGQYEPITTVGDNEEW